MSESFCFREVLLSLTLTCLSRVILGVTAAMNELRPCAPISLKNVLAQVLIKGLQAVSDSLLRYNATRMLRENESGLFLSLCRASTEVHLNEIGQIVTCKFYLESILDSFQVLTNFIHL